MSDDFYIEFFSASSYEDDICSRLAEPRERVNGLLPLLFQLIQSETKPDGFHDCPVCGQTIEVSFSKRFERSNRVNIGVDCKTCHMIVLFESDKVPSWASVSKFWD